MIRPSTLLRALSEEGRFCPDCDGQGFHLVCCDDICHGLGYCIHGDGEEPCARCGGQGWLPEPEDADRE